MTPSNPPAREASGKSAKKFLLWLLLCLGLGALASVGSVYWISNSMRETLHNQTAPIHKQIQDAEELVKQSEETKEGEETSLARANKDLEKIKFEEINSKLTDARNKKMDVVNKITSADKIREVLKSPDANNIINLNSEDLRKFMTDGEKHQAIVKKAESKDFSKAIKDNQPLLVPNAKAEDNPLIQAIQGEIKKTTKVELQKKKENEGLRLVHEYLERLAKDKKKWDENPVHLPLEKLAKGNNSSNGPFEKKAELEFPALAAMFPIGEKRSEVNLYFAFEYFPKHNAKLQKIIQEHDFGEKDPKKDPKGEKAAAKRKDWLEKHWKPMEELVSKAGIK